MSEFGYSSKKTSAKNLWFYIKLIGKYFYVFIATVVLSFAASVLICRTSMPTKYYSSGYFGLNQVVNSTVPNVTIEITCSETTCGNVYAKLSSDGVKHTNGDEISLAELKEGISAAHDDKSLRISVKYVNTDPAITPVVLNYFLDDVMANIEDETNYYSFRYLFIGGYANNVFEVPSHRPIVVFLGVFGSFILSYLAVALFDAFFGKITSCEYLRRYADVIEFPLAEEISCNIAVSNDYRDTGSFIPLESTYALSEIKPEGVFVIVKKRTRISALRKLEGILNKLGPYKICLTWKAKE